MCSVNDEECVPGKIRRGMCSRHYHRWLRLGRTSGREVVDNFQQYEVLENGCWKWTGRKFPSGYGKLSRPEYGTQRASRAFYIHFNGLITSDLVVDHVCHNNDLYCLNGVDCPHRLCVNPGHLEAVTHLINVKRGHHNILTENDVHEIRRSFSSGVKQQLLADRFGVKQATVSDIVTRKTWRHVS